MTVSGADLGSFRRRIARLDLEDGLVPFGTGCCFRFCRAWGRGGRLGNLGLGGLHQRLVDLAPRCSLGHEGVSRLQLAIDLRLERFERLRPRQEFPVDEERRRAARADLPALIAVGLDVLLELFTVERGLESAHVQPQLRRVLFQAGPVDIRLVGEQLVVHLPELSLLAGGAGRVGGGHRVGVKRQRQVLPSDSHLAFVFVHDLGQRRLDAAAERALKVRPHDDRDRGVLGPADRRRPDLGLEHRAGIGLTGILLRRGSGRLVEPVLGELGVQTGAIHAGSSASHPPS